MKLKYWIAVMGLAAAGMALLFPAAKRPSRGDGDARAQAGLQAG